MYRIKTMNKISSAGLAYLDQTRFQVGEDLENETYLWQNEYDESTSLLTMRLAFFVRDKDGRYRKFEETHVQRAHRVEEILRLLTDAGFEAVKITGDLTARAPKDTEDRWIVRCRRPLN